MVPPFNWDRYLEVLARRSVPKKMRPRYFRRVAGFLKARRPVSFTQMTAEEITGHLQQVSAQAKLADCQFRQTVDAWQLLFVDLGQCPAGKEVIGDWWKAGGRTLESDHPTIARYRPPQWPAMLAVLGSPARPTPSRYWRPLARTNRAMQYRIRTGQAYVDWCHHLLALCGETPTEYLRGRTCSAF